MKRVKKILRSIQKKIIIHVREVTRPYEIHLNKYNRFKDQIAIVTGGSGVIGRAIAYRLAAEGATVYVCGTRTEKLYPIIEEITNAGFVAKPLLFDIKDEIAISKAFKQVYFESGTIDTLVCCAGGGARDKQKPFIHQTAEVIDSVLDINLRGSIMCTQEACKIMVKKKRGNIIMISSTVGVCGMPAYSEYAAAKAGIIAFVKSIAMEMGKYGIRINCITPGIIERGTIDDIKMEQIHKTNWLNSYGKPEDVSGMVAYLNSEEADFITGQNYIIDGGRSLGLKQ